MKLIRLWGILLFVLTSCNFRSSDLEEALVLAGNNRPELEAVLDHLKTEVKWLMNQHVF